MILIVGLGNPGIKYRQSRHNIGFVIADAFIKDIGICMSPHIRFNSDLKKTVYSGCQILVAKPLSYMNNSGAPVSAICRHYDDIENIMVIHDDIDIEFGQVKFKRCGGPGGHNGIQSIISSLKTDVFDRLRIGVGRPLSGKDPADFVLDKFSKTENREINNIINISVDALKEYIEYGIDFAMNKYNCLKS
jgi:peptidyl-tRNA hydrolase, PTH1 family